MNLEMNVSKPTLLVLAAGMGSRYGGLKQMDAMGKSGEWLLQYALHDALNAGFGKVVFVIRKEFELVFRSEMEDRCPQGLEFEIAYQRIDDLPDGCCIVGDRTKPLGTAHAIWCARHAIEGPFAVINADDFYGREAYTAMANALNALSEEDGVNPFCMVAYRLGDTLSEHGHVARGVCKVDSDNQLVKVTEHTRIILDCTGPVDVSNPDEPVYLSKEDLVSMNFWGFGPGIFSKLEKAIREFVMSDGENPSSEIYIPFVVDELIRKNLARVDVLRAGSNWFGVTYPEDKSRVQHEIHKLIEAGTYPDPLACAISIID